MKKIVKIISVGLIAAAILFLLHFVLTLHAVDIWLTGKIVKNTPEKRSLIYTEWADAEYGIEETDKPCIFGDGDRRYYAGRNQYRLLRRFYGFQRDDPL